ncbi:hypothetical protein AWB77_01599 [Caballeronia fortuita]|uniref:Lipoprotein n=1 Tax=Caballeronia fortuita TaxID=1777138 RepID=A0A158ABG7_9BURK|nr:hypothetical protein [Caballeronia fortuita]SAK55168.1 hypothetical protein AWB77_01599 [Caballeronia fortuita]
MYILKRGHSIALCVACALSSLTASALAATPHGGRAASAAEVASGASGPSAASGASAQGIMSVDALPPNFTGDDPEHVRDALAGQPAPGQPASITGRVRAFLSRPFDKTSHGASQPVAQSDRMFTFVIPVSYGVRYLSKKKLLTVNVSLAAPASPDAILLKETVKGQSGRKLVVAPEAREKGFVQTFDVIQLKPQGGIKTTVSGRTALASFNHERGNGDFAIVLICTLAPPYLNDDIEHSAPTDEEPTDITRRTSTLNGRVDAAWLIDRKEGTIITKRLRLVK